MGNISALKPAKRQPSKQFRSHQVLKQLREHFKECWEHDKANSPKLEFYHHIKKNFTKEPYLDILNNPTHRYKTTQLRISSHNLSIERGRYENIPREERVCNWCSLSLGERIIENESHVLFNCKLYTNTRAKLVNDIIKAPDCDDTFSIPSFIHHNNITLQDSIMKLLSPNTSTSIDYNDPLHHHHLTISGTIFDPSHTSSPNFNARSHITNSICAFFARIFDLRRTFLNESRLYGNTIPTYNEIL